MISYAGDNPLEQARQREEVLVAILLAIEHSSAIAKLASEAPTSAEIRKSLMASFALNERQSQVVLELPVQRLCKLERARFIRN